MPQHVFTVARAGQLCLLQGGGTYTIKRKQADGKYGAYNVDGRTLSVGSANTCVVITTPGEYKVEYTLTAIKCDAGADPVFQYTEGAGVCEDGAPGAKGDTGPQGIPGIIDITNPVAVSELMTAMSANPDAITINDAFGSPIFVGLPA